MQGYFLHILQVAKNTKFCNVQSIFLNYFFIFGAAIFLLIYLYIKLPKNKKSCNVQSIKKISYILKFGAGLFLHI